MVWSVVRSTKFCVADPVPPLAMGRVPLYAVAVTSLHVAVPLPLVFNTCPILPSVVGNETVPA